MTTLGTIGFIVLFFTVVGAALWSFEGVERSRQREQRWWRGQ